MLFGIEYYPNKKGLKLAYESLQKYVRAILSHGTCELYFTSIVEAYLTSRELSKLQDNLTYKVFIPNPQLDGVVLKDNIVSTKEEYFARMKIRTQQLLD